MTLLLVVALVGIGFGGLGVRGASAQTEDFLPPEVVGTEFSGVLLGYAPIIDGLGFYSVDTSAPQISTQPEETIPVLEEVLLPPEVMGTELGGVLWILLGYAPIIFGVGFYSVDTSAPQLSTQPEETISVVEDILLPPEVVGTELGGVLLGYAPIVFGTQLYGAVTSEPQLSTQPEETVIVPED